MQQACARNKHFERLHLNINGSFGLQAILRITKALMHHCITCVQEYINEIEENTIKIKTNNQSWHCKTLQSAVAIKQQ